MQIYLAPLQGITDWIFRESFYEHIAQFDKSFSPFIRIENKEFLRKSQCNDILPTHNTFQKPIPQFLGNDYESFVSFVELCKSHNYTEVNINLGCPFIKVTKQKLGAGLLGHPEEINTLLSQVFTHTDLQISIKCRLGLESIEEFKALIPIFNAYPIHEIIIHARTGVQLYQGKVYLDDYIEYAKQLKAPVCFNGDITTSEQIRALEAQNITSIMIGRGICKNLFLLHEYRNIELSKEEKKQKLYAFHIAILKRCEEKYSGDFSVLQRLKEFWEHHSHMYENPHKAYKIIKKCSSLKKYRLAFPEIIQTL